jgi:hypothetical protein
MEFQPGDIVRRYASYFNLPICEKSILVEGENDQRYFHLAANLYFEATGKKLLGDRLSLFPTGIGDLGGTYGILTHFHSLRQNMKVDVTSDGKPVYHVIALFDSDSAGKKAFGELAAQYLEYRKWRDIFLLHRIIPRSSRDPKYLERLVAEANHSSRSLDCEIEDLIAKDLVEDYVDMNPNAITKALAVIGDAFHVDFVKGQKGRFCGFVEQNALVEDVVAIVEVLKALRYFLGLAPDGD